MIKTHRNIGSNMFSDQPELVTSQVNQSGWQGAECDYETKFSR